MILNVFWSIMTFRIFFYVFWTYFGGFWRFRYYSRDLDEIGSIPTFDFSLVIYTQMVNLFLNSWPYSHFYQILFPFLDKNPVFCDVIPVLETQNNIFSHFIPDRFLDKLDKFSLDTVLVPFLHLCKDYFDLLRGYSHDRQQIWGNYFWLRNCNFL